LTKREAKIKAYWLAALLIPEYNLEREGKDFAIFVTKVDRPTLKPT